MINTVVQNYKMPYKRSEMSDSYAHIASYVTFFQPLYSNKNLTPLEICCPGKFPPLAPPKYSTGHYE